MGKNNFETFDDMLEYFEKNDYRVKRVNDDAAIVFNNGVDIDFTMFDVFVTTVAVEDNDFRYRNPDNMQEMYEKTVEEQKDPNDLDMELYIGLYKGEDPTALDGYGYQFS